MKRQQLDQLRLFDKLPPISSTELVLRDDETIKSFSLSMIQNKVIQGDALSVLRKIESEIFDLIFIDPPYFLQLPNKQLKRWKVQTIVEGVDDAWDKFSSFEDYDTFITRLLIEARRVLKPTGTIWVISTYHSIFRIGKIMQDLGYWILNDIVWVKTNPMPNWLGVRFTNATEHLIWAVKDKKCKQYTFNRDYAKKFGIGRVGANVWVLPICTGSERLRTKEGKKLHSTQKPSELLKRVLLTTTKPGDLVLDPVAGTGTTGYVAHALGRNFVMIELNPDYIQGIVERFSHEPKLNEDPIPPLSQVSSYMGLGGTHELP